MIKHVRQILDRYDGNHRLTSGELVDILAALVKGQDEQVREIAEQVVLRHYAQTHMALPTEERVREIASDIAWRKAAEWLKDHKRGSHDSLPKFDLEGALRELPDIGEKVRATHLHRAWIIYHHGAEPARPEETGELAELGKMLTATMPEDHTRLDEIITRLQEIRSAPDRPLEVGDKVSLRVGRQSICGRIGDFDCEDSTYCFRPDEWTEDEWMWIKAHRLTRLEE